MTYDEYKKHLEACGPLDDISKGLLSAFELGYGQGIKDGKTHFTKALAEPEQEPMAWVDARPDGYDFWGLREVPFGKHYLYTAPPSIEAAVLAEREACAKWLRDNYQDYKNIADICEAIRARGKK